VTRRAAGLASWRSRCSGFEQRRHAHRPCHLAALSSSPTRPFHKPLEPRGASAYLQPRPNSHVPVAACRSVGIRTRGRTAASGSITFPNPWTDSQRRNWRTPPSVGDAAQSNDGAGFFGLCRSSKDRRGYRRGLSFFARRADRAFPSHPRHSARKRAPARIASPSRDASCLSSRRVWVAIRP
jgi:hypothetical protein